MSAIRFGPSRVPARESPEQAIAVLQERGYTACEIAFEGGLSTGEPMVPPWAPSFRRPTSNVVVAPAGQSPAPPPGTASRSSGEGP